ncbi:MAG: hypothetical protein ACI9HK_005593 [Pirellulaceae bacterium]|jgi:hypothetical protein
MLKRVNRRVSAGNGKNWQECLRARKLGSIEEIGATILYILQLAQTPDEDEIGRSSSIFALGSGKMFTVVKFHVR